MMEKIKLFAMVTLLGSSFFLNSCAKEGCTDPQASNYDNDAAKDDGSCEYPPITIEIITPVADTTFSQGDVVKVKATANFSQTMHGWEYYIYNKTTGDTVAQDAKHAHFSFYDIMGSWENDVTEESVMELGIRVFENHEGDEVSGKITFHCLP